VQRATLKNIAPMLTLNNWGALFFSVDRGEQSIFVLLYHEINATNLCRHPWRSNIEYVLSCLILQSDQKIDAYAWCHVVYTLFPGNRDYVISCSPKTWSCTDETWQHCLLLHITWRALDQSRSCNSDLDITIINYQHAMLCRRQHVKWDKQCKMMLFQ